MLWTCSGLGRKARKVADQQKLRERDNAVRDKVMSSLGFVADRVEGDAY